MLVWRRSFLLRRSRLPGGGPSLRTLRSEWLRFSLNSDMAKIRFGIFAQNSTKAMPLNMRRITENGNFREFCI